MAIVGSVAAGKSSLVAAMLGELDTVPPLAHARYSALTHPGPDTRPHSAEGEVRAFARARGMACLGAAACAGAGLCVCFPPWTCVLGLRV